MNLLIIGNGLDLDLGLPTKYSDFLNFSRAFIFLIATIKKSNSPNLIEPYEK